MCVKPVGLIALAPDDLSTAHLARIGKAARQKIWQTNIVDLRQGRIQALSMVLRRQIFERPHKVDAGDSDDARVDQTIENDPTFRFSQPSDHALPKPLVRDRFSVFMQPREAQIDDRV